MRTIAIASLVAMAVFAQRPARGSETLTVQVVNPHYHPQAGCALAGEQALLLDQTGSHGVGAWINCIQSVSFVEGSSIFVIQPEIYLSGGAISGQGTATINPSLGTIAFDLAIVGGAGRFANATGSVVGGGPYPPVPGSPGILTISLD